MLYLNSIPKINYHGLITKFNFTFDSKFTAALSIYVPSDEHPRSLLPSLGENLLADCLPDALQHKLCKLADEGKYPLR